MQIGKFVNKLTSDKKSIVKNKIGK